MALLNAAELLRDDEIEQNITIKNIKMDELDEPGSLTITLKRSRKIVSEYRRIRDAHTKIKTTLKTKGKRKGDLDIRSEVDDAHALCREVLDLAYVDSSGDLLDEYSVDLIMLVCELYPFFFDTLSNALADFFERGGKFIEEEEEEDKKK